MAQGDPLTLLTMNCLTGVFVKAIADGHPLVESNMFLDDTSLTAEEQADLCEANSLLREFDKLAGQKSNHNKLQIWSSNSVDRIKLAGEFDRAAARNPVALGAVFPIEARKKFSRAHAICEDIESGLAQARKLPFSSDDKAFLVAAGPMSTLKWATEIQGAPKADLRTLRSATLSSLARGASHLRAPAIVFTILFQGH